MDECMLLNRITQVMRGCELVYVTVSGPLIWCYYLHDQGLNLVIFADAGWHLSELHRDRSSLARIEQSSLETDPLITRTVVLDNRASLQ
jgi:hypothetical protein